MSQASASSTKAMNGSIARSTHSGSSSGKSKKEHNDMTKARVQDYLESDIPYSDWTASGHHTDKQATQNAQNSMAGKLSAFDDTFHSHR